MNTAAFMKDTNNTCLQNIKQDKLGRAEPHPRKTINRYFFFTGTNKKFGSPDLLQILWEGGWAYKENFSSPSFCCSSKTVAVRGKSAEH